MAQNQNLLHIQVQGIAVSAGPKTKNIFQDYFFGFQSGPGLANKTAMAASFMASTVAAIHALLSVNYQGVASRVRWISDALDAWAVSSVPANGAKTGDSLPSLNNVCVQLRTPFRGKSYRGSKHFGPIAESDTLVDALSASAITAWNAAIPALVGTLSDGAGNTYFPCVLSRQFPYQVKVNPTAGTFTQITAVVLDENLGQMKRRKQVS
jgi:hypothetical protein